MDSLSGVLLFAVWYVVFLLSLTCHEAAHAFVALRGGDDTAYRAGQVTLNPLPHMRREPIGTIVVPLLTYFQLGYVMGWASAPYDPDWGRRHPARAAVMALAGPLANLVLAVVAFSGLKAGLATVGGLGFFLTVLLFLNVALFLFNLIPLPPMDGASVLAGFFSPARRLLEQMTATPFGSLAGLFVAWWMFPRILNPVLGWIGGLLR